jgi:hypothetical protein
MEPVVAVEGASCSRKEEPMNRPSRPSVAGRVFDRMAVVVVVVIAVATLEGCKSPQERLHDARRALREQEDALFAQYGGSDVAAAIALGARHIAASAETAAGTSAGGASADPLSALVGQVIGNGAKEMDREMFSRDCRAFGRGERVPLFTDKARAFFSRPDTLAACTQMATLVSTIARWEAELGVAPHAMQPVPEASP